MSNENQPLAGKVALVTGTTQGIGRGIAEALTREGATVHGIDKDTVDVTDSAAVNAFVASIGGADILVNSAGGVRGQVGKPIEDVTDEQWRDVVESNLTGAFVCVRAVVPGMKERGWGRIVTISSGAGRSVSLTGIQAYASAKAAQIGFTRQMAHELGRFGITVNCVAPGFVLSNPTSIAQWESYGAEGQQKLLDAIPTRRLGTAEDIANGVRFFVSPDSSWISGQTLSVDGGHALY
ncbi:MAG TPA: SDR family NAD(P)-dependent oxidoreductase [Acidimicrobiales bacterium]|nr:SDR family NAD(P)-dependent oxidoreductase [Acidimicrobiales bacterium]